MIAQAFVLMLVWNWHIVPNFELIPLNYPLSLVICMIVEIVLNADFDPMYLDLDNTTIATIAWVKLARLLMILSLSYILI